MKTLYNQIFQVILLNHLKTLILNIFTGTEERKSEQANISYAPSLLDHAKHNEWTLYKTKKYQFFLPNGFREKDFNDFILIWFISM